MATPFRLLAYRDSLTLWSDAASKAPRKPRIHINLADAFNKGGDPVAAMRELRIARALLPAAPLAWERRQTWLFLVNVELGMLANKDGHSDLASQYFQGAVEAAPQLVTWTQPLAP